MLSRMRQVIAWLVAVMLVTIAPSAAVGAGDAVTATVPLDVNLLRDPGFDWTPSATSPVPGWAVTGDVHTETFGTRAFPYPAYGRKYHGGRRYLSCYGGHGGSVRQTIELTGRVQRSYKLRARIATSLGGVTGHRVRVSIRTVGVDPQAVASKTRVLEITNHYKRATTALTLPVGTTALVATIQLLPKVGAARCKVMADSAEVFLYRP
jgi:hypothetical protein